MKNLFLAFLLFPTSILVYGQQGDIDVTQYRFEIGLSDTNDSITGKASVSLRLLHRADKITLNLAGIDDKGKGMTVLSCLINNKPVKGNLLNDELELPLPVEGKPGDTMKLQVEYKGIPADGLIISRNKYGKRTFFADNWPNRGHNWLPCNDNPADKAPVEFIVTAPAHYQVVANGIQVEETNLPDNKKRTHWKEEVPVSTKVMVIGVADFAVQLSGFINNCIPVYSWVYPEDRNKGFYDYAQANEILPWFIRNVGPYAYKKLANVESKTIFGGLENANTIFYSETSVDGKRSSESLLAHEIAHQWFGNMATEKSFAHLWLSEGFATYMTILYFQDKYGADTALHMLKEDRTQVIGFARQSDRAVVDNDPDYMQLLNSNSYQKGSWVLHMLRKQLGDSAFWKSIRSYYATYAGKTADTDDLRKIFEKVSGKDLAAFFKQWLYTPGIPELDIKWKYDTNERSLSVTVKQLQKIPFSFPIEIGYQSSQIVKVIKTLSISKQSETFKIPITQKPSKLLADPDINLLFKGNIAEEN